MNIVTPDTIVEVILSIEDAWKAVAAYVQVVLRAKQEWMPGGPLGFQYTCHLLRGSKHAAKLDVIQMGSVLDLYGP